MKPTFTKVFLQVAQKTWKSQGETSGLYGGCLRVSQLNLRTISLTRLTVWGRVLSCKRITPSDSIPERSDSIPGRSDSIPGRFDFMVCRSILSHQETNRTSLLFFACLHFQCWINTLYTNAHLQSNKETTVWTCALSLRMLPTLPIALWIRNNSVASFCEECVLWRVFGFNLTTTYIYTGCKKIPYTNFEGL